MYEPQYDATDMALADVSEQLAAMKKQHQRLCSLLIELRDDIRATPMMHPADAAARERWADQLSEWLRQDLR